MTLNGKNLKQIYLNKYTYDLVKFLNCAEVSEERVVS